MIPDSDQFFLTPGDRNSSAWVKLLAHFNSQIEMLRARNDGPHDATVTAALRGQIAVYKALIDLDQDLPVIE